MYSLLLECPVSDNIVGDEHAMCTGEKVVSTELWTVDDGECARSDELWHYGKSHVLTGPSDGECRCHGTTIGSLFKDVGICLGVSLLELGEAREALAVSTYPPLYNLEDTQSLLFNQTSCVLGYHSAY